MANKTNLLKRSGRWYFNRAFPKNLWPVTGKAPFRRSLNTSSLQEAQRKRPDVDKDYYEAVDAAKRKLAVPAFDANAAGQPFGESNVLPVLAEWYHETVDFIQNIKRTSFNPDQHDIELEKLSDELAEAKEELATGSLWMSKRLAKEALREAGFVVGEREPFDRLIHLIARGRVPLLSRAIFAHFRRQQMLPNEIVYPTQKFLTLTQFCQRYQVSRSTIYRRAEAGDFKIIKFGRSSRIAFDEAEAWAASLPAMGR